MKKVLLTLAMLLISCSYLSAVSIDISDATLTITGATTFTLNNVYAVSRTVWIDCVWDAGSNKFIPEDYGLELAALDGNEGIRALGENTLELPVRKRVPIDISDAVPEILSATEFKLSNVAAFGETYWGEWRWNSVTNKFDTYDYGIETDWTCDYFDRENSTIVEGWTEQAGDWSIYENKLASQVSASWQYITYDGSSQADGCIEGRAMYYGSPSVQFIGFVSRYASTASYGILAKIQDNSTSGAFDRIFIYQNGSMLAYADIAATTDANIQLEYVGSVVYFRVDVDRNGTWDSEISASVSWTVSGLTGVCGYRGTYMDDWCYGTECANYLSRSSDTAPVKIETLNAAEYDAAIID